MRNFDKIKDILRQIKWWEWLYTAFFICLFLSFGIAFHSNAVAILYPIFNVLTIFLLGKGWFFGNIFGMLATIFYVTLGFLNHLYGEVIVSMCLSMPTYIMSFYTWIRNKNSKSHTVKINSSMGVGEWLIAIPSIAVLCVGFYYLLQFFGTAFLLVSIFSSGFHILACYLQIRRCEVTFLGYMMANLISAILWGFVMTTNISYVITMVTCIIQVILNFIALLNWLRMKKYQNAKNEFVVDDKILEIIRKEFN